MRLRVGQVALIALAALAVACSGGSNPEASDRVETLASDVAAVREAGDEPAAASPPASAGDRSGPEGAAASERTAATPTAAGEAAGEAAEPGQEAGSQATAREPNPSAAATEAQYAGAGDADPEPDRGDSADQETERDESGLDGQPDREGPSLRILARDAEGRGSVPIAGAHVVSENGALRSDADGFVPVEEPAERYQVVAAGYWPARNVSPEDGVITLRPLEVRAIYLPYEQLWNPPSLAWVLELARLGLISAIVIDVKEEGGAVLPDFATEAVLAIDAVVDPGTDVAAFLSELEALGIYRIARQSVFLDTRLGRSDVETAILTRDGRQLIDNLGLGWTTPFSATARRYNIEIAVRVAGSFEEIQFDYLRFPAGPLRVHEETTGEERSAAVALFAEEAVAALHAVGAAMSIDTFGETAVIRVEDAIGQVLEDLIPHIDYYSPMVYPSTFSAGWFDLPYPAADPETVVLLSVAAAVERVQASGAVGVLVRPWLQDYRDYGPQQISYGFNEVLIQILATEEAGGVGFMLWDPTLLYRTDVLVLFVREAAGAG